MSYLKNIGIVKGKNNVTSNLFEQLCTETDLRSALPPAQFIDDIWRKFSQTPEVTNKGIAGKFFEYVIAAALARESILPFYMQAALAFIPNVRYDFLLYTAEHGPVSLSAKTSLRERYKQADLEGMVLKNVHRRALSYLLTLDAKAANIVDRKIKQGEVLGIDSIVIANEESMNFLVRELKRLTPQLAVEIPVVTAEKCVRAPD